MCVSFILGDKDRFMWILKKNLTSVMIENVDDTLMATLILFSMHFETKFAGR